MWKACIRNERCCSVKNGFWQTPAWSLGTCKHCATCLPLPCPSEQFISGGVHLATWLPAHCLLELPSVTNSYCSLGREEKDWSSSWGEVVPDSHRLHQRPDLTLYCYIPLRRPPPFPFGPNLLCIPCTRLVVPLMSSRLVASCHLHYQEARSAGRCHLDVLLHADFTLWLLW